MEFLLLTAGMLPLVPHRYGDYVAEGVKSQTSRAMNVARDIRTRYTRAK